MSIEEAKEEKKALDAVLTAIVHQFQIKKELTISGVKSKMVGTTIVIETIIEL